MSKETHVTIVQRDGKFTFSYSGAMVFLPDEEYADFRANVFQVIGQIERERGHNGEWGDTSPAEIAKHVEGYRKYLKGIALLRSLGLGDSLDADQILFIEDGKIEAMTSCFYFDGELMESDSFHDNHQPDWWAHDEDFPRDLPDGIYAVDVTETDSFEGQYGEYGRCEVPPYFTPTKYEVTKVSDIKYKEAFIQASVDIAPHYSYEGEEE